MIMSRTSWLTTSAIVLMVICIISAGCTSGKAEQPPPATTVPTPFPTKPQTTSQTPAPVPVATTGSDLAVQTCSQLKGITVVPGQECPGRWLTAYDSFSCCSQKPVTGKTAKPRMTAEPLDLRITHNDMFVDIGSG